MTPDRCEKVKTGGGAARHCSLVQALVNVSDNYNRSKVVRNFLRFARGLERLWHLVTIESAACSLKRTSFNRLYAGKTVVSGATRKSNNASGAVDQQERSAQAEILRDHMPNFAKARKI